MEGNATAMNTVEAHFTGVRMENLNRAVRRLTNQGLVRYFLQVNPPGSEQQRFEVEV